MAVITISRQYGSGGDEIAAQVAQDLDYRLFNKEMIEEAARAEGLRGEDVLSLVDDSRIKGFLERLFSFMPPMEYYQPSDAAPMFLTEDEALSLYQKAVLAGCERGNMVIVGRGAQALLKDQPGVLHVRIEAPIEICLERVQQEQGLDRKHAIDRIAAHDRARREFIQRYYEIDWAETRLYHLVINTGKVDAESAVRLIEEAARLILREKATV